MQNPRGFDHVETWIFDLDNTLYPPSCRLFDLIDQRMTLYISNLLSVDPVEARKLQKDYYRQYGTSLRGLMETRGIDPHEFMDFVHDISHDALVPNPALKTAIAALPGKRYVLTNGSRAHAERCAVSLGLGDLFHDIFDVAQANFIPKPKREAYDSFISHLGVKPEGSAMFEDLARNLEVPHALGMTTVLVLPKDGDVDERAMHAEDSEKGPYVDHVTDDLADFLAGLKR
ncbi:pyrimidine 5'-nucleotidase [Terrihabitans soli]|uniref:Pyrimidine 5'-nucleotidase n=1 Tax=Terrihabitans soli TaxID=708113 RepID=A0A6S6QK87_9HYPH|nr:pyrimidine 5'-nucleotidase [Terrihabitans soli]BCJ91703.1 pyrimidine 5'-nucleotidase [Terrihabitans soli]